MEVLTTVILVYMFLAIYFCFFFLILYARNRTSLFWYPSIRKKFSVSVLIPAYNEQESIGSTVENVFLSRYPVKEVIVIDDGSKDNTAEITRRLMKKYPKLKLLSKKNSGKADSINQALKIASGELIAVLDADSYPEKNAFKKMVGYFSDTKMGAVTSCIVPKKREKFIEKLQSYEYVGIAWTRKLLDSLDAVFVTPGGLSLYRKSALIEAKGFDKNNITEDIEIAWHLIHNGYKIRMSLAAKSYTIAPDNFRQWKKQRVRWGAGGLQTLGKYKKDFLKKGMFGLFIIPFVFTAIFLGLSAFLIGWYIIIKRLFTTFFYMQYSFSAQTPLLTLGDFNIAPSVLIIYGIFLFITGFTFTVFGLRVMKEENLGKLKDRNLFNLLFYMVVYLGLYYTIWMIAIIQIIFSKKIKWGTK